MQGIAPKAIPFNGFQSQLLNKKESEKRVEEVKVKK